MSSFADLADAFLKEEFAESPVQASSLGLTAYDEKLDDLSAEAFRRHEERSASWLARFRALPDDALSPAERIDRDFASSILRGRELTAPRRNWQRQPATYLNPGLQGVFSLFLHKLRPQVFKRIIELDVLGDGHTVFGDLRRAPAFVEHGIASPRSEGRAHRASEFRDSREQLLTCFVAVSQLFSRHPHLLFT